jgi:hypothetical protein
MKVCGKYNSTEFSGIPKALFSHDCEQFDLADVNIHVFEQLRADIESTQENFKIYEEFDMDLRKLGEMEWILFRFVIVSNTF